MSVAVAMSGGLDSSVVAWLLARQEPSVIGLSMLLWDESREEPSRPSRLPTVSGGGSGRCCGALDLGDAKRVAAQAGIAHYTLRMDDEFRQKVVDPFVRDYLAGRTPSPCVSCNTAIKFSSLYDRARSFGAGTVATGHYARIVPGPEGLELHAAVDAEKDQSYFLFELTQEQLARTLFPLGELTKHQVRELAREAGLYVADKGESQDLCFVAGGVGEFVERQVAERGEGAYGAVASRATAAAAEGGRIVDAESGEELGRGAPYFRYTVGQRRGLGVAAGERLYVLGVEPEANRVAVGPARALEVGALSGERLHWLAPEFAGQRQVPVTVKIRSRHQGAEAVVRPVAGCPDGTVQVELARPERGGVTPGQAAVFYRGTRVLGGCWITGGIRVAAD